MEIIYRSLKLLVVLSLLLTVDVGSVGVWMSGVVHLVEIQVMSAKLLLSVNESWRSIDPKSVLFFCLFLLLWGCKLPNKVSDNPMSVDIDARHEVSIFDIFERIELIPLETTDESIFRHVNRLRYHNGVLYILDFRKIFAFDSTTGKFLFKIDDAGQGPQQYLHINDFEIDRQRNKILVLDPIARNLLEYDLNGRFVRRTRLPEIIHAYGSLRSLDDDVIVFQTFDPNNMLKFYSRSQDSIFSEHFPVEESRRFNFGTGFLRSNSFIMRDLAFNNNLYEVFPDGTYSIAYTWDFGRLNNCITKTRNFPERPRSQEEREEQNRRFRNSELVNYFFWLVGGNQTYRYAQIIRRNQYIHLLHNIAEKRTHVFTEFSGGVSFYPVFWSDEFVIGLGPFAGYNEETIPDAILDERNLEIKRNICEFDNPVLIKYFFRR